MSKDLTIHAYQEACVKTRIPDLDSSIFYYGLMSESAGLVSIYKKALRDAEPSDSWINEFAEELGDTLWYLAIIANLQSLSLVECALAHLTRLGSQQPLNSSLSFEEYQNCAQANKKEKEHSLELNRTTSLLGIVAESGKQLYQYQLQLRDRAPTAPVTAEHIGNILWYLADLAHLFQLDLGNIAKNNISKTNGLFGTIQVINELYDDDYPKEEQFPREFTIYFYDTPSGYCKLLYNGVFIGDQLDDNSIARDGYRFHDAIHLAHLAVLGWSPVMRALLKRKRKSDGVVDRSEDGQRAIIIEEAIVALNFTYAKSRNYFKDNANISTAQLKHLKALTQDLEVSASPMSLWKKAILEGFSVYNSLRDNKGGAVKVDLNNREILYAQTPSEYTLNL